MVFANLSWNLSHTTIAEKVSSIALLYSRVYLSSCEPVGFIDGRTVRLPTVCIRTGAPSSAASSFISGLVREPLQGIKTVCPIADSHDDEAIEGMPIYVTRVKTVVDNIARAINVKAQDIEQKVGKTRCINLPGIKITTRDILNAV